MILIPIAVWQRETNTESIFQMKGGFHLTNDIMMTVNN